MPDLISLSRRSFMILPLAFAACRRGPHLLSFSGLTMGTTYSVAALDMSRRMDEAELRGVVETALAEVNQQMSNWDSRSEISRFNAQAGTAPVTVSPALAEVMQAAHEVQVASDGRFDTTMGPLIELWGFGAPGSTSLPADAEIEAALARSGHTRTLQIGQSALQKTQGEAQVYLAAIGKGYGADRVARALNEMGLTDYMIEIGGDLYASGRNLEGMPWQIGIENPTAFGGGVYEVVGVSGLGMASSGDYRNFFEEDGTRFSHLIDPATGRPVTHRTASATVLAENAMLADAWSTAMLILGRERGLEIAENHGVAVHFIERNREGGENAFTRTTSSRYEELTA